MESKPHEDHEDADKSQIDSAKKNEEIRSKVEEEKQEEKRQAEMDKKFSVPPDVFRQACNEVA